MDLLGEQVWPLFSRCTRRAQAEWDELSSSQAGFERRIAEASAEVEALRTSSSDLEENNRRLTEERDHALAEARELRAGLDEREVASQGLTQTIVNRETELAVLRAEQAALDAGSKRIGRHTRPRSQRFRLASTPPRATIAAWPKSETKLNPQGENFVSLWTSASLPVTSWPGKSPVAMPSWLRSRANALHWNIGFTTIGERARLRWRRWKLALTRLPTIIAA